MRNVAGLVLAAGGSSRFGRPKQLVVWQGETLVRRAVRAAMEGGCSAVAVVVGDDAKEIESELRETSTAIVLHPEWQRGLGSSIRRGVDYFAAQELPPEALVLLACDQPFVDAGVVAALITPWAAGTCEIATSQYSSTLGVPALFDRVCFAELRSLPDESGAKLLFARSGRAIAAVPFPKGIVDIDTPGDLERRSDEPEEGRSPGRPGPVG